MPDTIVYYLQSPIQYLPFLFEGAKTFEIFRKCEECKITTDILLDSNARTMDENDQSNPETEVKFKKSFDTDEILGAPGKT